MNCLKAVSISAFFVDFGDKINSKVEGDRERKFCTLFLQKKIFSKSELEILSNFGIVLAKYLFFYIENYMLKVKTHIDIYLLFP